MTVDFFVWFLLSFFPVLLVMKVRCVTRSYRTRSRE